MRRIIIVTVIAFYVIISFSICANAEEYPQSELLESSMISCDSNSTGAYIFGIKENTLYSSMLCPHSVNFSVSVDYKLKSAVQSGDKTYGLYSIDKDRLKGDYGIVEINSNGKTAVYEFSGVHQLLNQQFSVSDNCVFFVRTNKVRAYVAVYSLKGGYIKDYDFDDDVFCLFNNNGITYVMLYNGKIFHLSKSTCKYVVKIDEAERFSNAGCNWIYTYNGSLINLADGSVTEMKDGRGNPAVCDSKGVYLIAKNIAEYHSFVGEVRTGVEMYPEFLLVYGDNLICVSDDYNYRIINKSEFKKTETADIGEDNNNKGENKDESVISKNYIIRDDKYLCGVGSGAKVSDFIKQFNDGAVVSDSSGNIVTAGNIRSGYVVSYGSRSLIISVKGDISGEGNIKSNDIKLLMKHFADSANLTELQIISADYNLDNKVSNMDLVMLARCVRGIKW